MLDKEGAAARDSIFMVDASKGFIKDGPKNRLRERDIHRIIDTVANRTEIAKFSRIVPITEIADAKNDYNLNLPRYIDTSDAEDLQDLDAHLNGGIPNRDIDDLSAYWAAFPNLRKTMFVSAGRDGYSNLAVPASEVNVTIGGSAEFATLSKTVHERLDTWRSEVRQTMLDLNDEERPKAFIAELSESLLTTFRKTALIDEYAIYQSLMEFWSTTMQDDAYLIVDAGWEASAKPGRLDPKSKDRVDFTIGKDKFKSELIPAELLINQYFATEQAGVQDAEALVASASHALDDLFEEHGGDDGLLAELFGEKTRIARKDGAARLKEKGLDTEEKAALNEYLKSLDAEAAAKEIFRNAEEALNTKVAAKYGKLTNNEIRTLVVDHKWLHQVAVAVDTELQRLSSTLSGRLRQLATRYDDTLPTIASVAVTKTKAVESHLKKMGLSW